MNRKNFFKQAIGATIATVVGSKLDFIPEPKQTGVLQLAAGIGKSQWLTKRPIPTGPGIMEQLSPEMQLKMDEFRKEWLKRQEMQIWYGTPGQYKNKIFQ